MKKGLIAAGLLVSLSGTAQDVSTYTPGTMGEGVVYYLPKTEIELQVTATKVVYTPGEFCQYADRYLRLTGISSQPEEHWEINSIKVNSIGIPDPDNAYAVKLKDKSAASQVELTPEGIIKAINTTSPIEKAPVTKVADTVKKRIDPRSFMTEEILIAGSTAKMAELVAKEIYNIRESKNSLTRGQADYMPKDGSVIISGLKRMPKPFIRAVFLSIAVRKPPMSSFPPGNMPACSCTRRTMSRFFISRRG